MQNTLNLDSEEWKPVVGYEGYYEVSNHGNVRSLLAQGERQRVIPKVLKPGINTCGYQVVVLYKGVKSTKTVHRLVAKAFIEGVGVHINHKDEVKLNNNVSNLEWCTHQYNLEYSLSKHFVFIDPFGDIHRVFNLRKFARDYGLSPGALHGVYTGKHRHHKGWTAYV